MIERCTVGDCDALVAPGRSVCPTHAEQIAQANARLAAQNEKDSRVEAVIAAARAVVDKWEPLYAAHVSILDDSPIGEPLQKALDDLLRTISELDAVKP